MKSLEIVNDKIAELKDTYQHYTAVEKDKVKSSFAKFDIEQFQQIKQDLEVLEIINKLLSRIDYVDYGGTTRPCFVVNKFVETKDIEKLKQWLEVNDNENI